MDQSVTISDTLSRLANKKLEGRLQYNRKNPIGVGGQGIVYKGTLEAENHVAVKELRVILAQFLKLSKVRQLLLLRLKAV